MRPGPLLTHSLSVAEGSRILERALPGRAVASLVVVAGEWWLIIDPAKAGSAEHAARLVAEAGGW